MKSFGWSVLLWAVVALPACIGDPKQEKGGGTPTDNVVNDPPSGLSAKATGSATIELSWKNNAPQADSFELERGLNNTVFALVTTLGPNKTSYTDAGLLSATKFFYRIRAKIKDTYTDYSELASDTTQDVQEFAKRYGTATYQEARGFFAATDGNLVIGGNHIPVEGSAKVMLVAQMDKQGAVQWAKSIKVSNIDALNAIMPLQSDYVVVGVTQTTANDGTTGPNRGVVMRIDSQGTLKWAKMLYPPNPPNPPNNPPNPPNPPNLPQGVTLNSAAVGEDGSIYCAGNFKPQGAIGSSALLVKLSSDGSLSWTKKIDVGAVDRMFSITRTVGGGFAFLGTTKNGTTTSMLIGKINADGDLQWTRRIFGMNFESVSELKVTNDGGLAFVGATEWAGTTNGDYLLVKLSGQGSVTWAKSFGTNNSERAVGLAVSSTGGFIVAGEEYVPHANGMVVSLDSEGEVLWSRRLAGQNEDRQHRVGILTDGSIVALGDSSSYTAGSLNITLVKFNGQGETTATNAIQPANLSSTVVTLQQEDLVPQVADIELLVPAATPTIGSVTLTSGDLP